MTNVVAPERLKTLYAIGTRWVGDSEVGDDINVYIDSFNLHRRNLNSKDYRQRIANLVKADPTRSDRSIAKEVGKSPSTIGAIRSHPLRAVTPRARARVSLFSFVWSVWFRFFCESTFASVCLLALTASW